MPVIGSSLPSISAGFSPSSTCTDSNLRMMDGIICSSVNCILVFMGCPSESVIDSLERRNSIPDIYIDLYCLAMLYIHSQAGFRWCYAQRSLRHGCLSRKRLIRHLFVELVFDQIIYP